MRLLAPHLTPDNHRGVLESARGKRRKSEVEEIVVKLLPLPDVPPSIRKLPWPKTGSVPAAAPLDAAAPVAPALPAQPLPSPVGSAGVMPLAPDRYKVQLTIGGDTLEKLRLAASQPRPAGGTAPGSRHIPAEVKRAVFLRRAVRVRRDQRPPLRRARFLEFHHVRPYAVGGEATVENVQLRCRSHNGYEARVYFGPGSPNGRGAFVREKAAPYGRFGA